MSVGKIVFDQMTASLLRRQNVGRSNYYRAKGTEPIFANENHVKAVAHSRLGRQPKTFWASYLHFGGVS